MEKDGLEEKLLVMGVAPTSIEALLENIFEPDEIEIDIEPPETCHVKTMRIKNNGDAEIVDADDPCKTK